MKRFYSVIGIGLLMLLLCACGGGGDNGQDQLNDGPLTIQLLRATPSTGTSPLRVTFTVSISGGVAPYYYSWDYTNDGSVDDFINQTFDRTLSVSNDYFIRASDAGDTSVYECQLKVMDSSGDPAIVPDPLTVTVLSGSGITFGDQTYWFSDFTDTEGDPVARTDEPVYFRVQPLAGVAPYTYQWDFDEDGQIDSTVSNPQYTFTYSGEGADIRKVSVIVVDNENEKAKYDFLVPVFGPGSDPEPNIQFEAILNSSPGADQDGVITLNWASEGTSGLPTEPELDLSVIIDPDPEKKGVPPYEYYWDFENDGKFDTQDPSPTLPYYDYERKITVNPYTHLLNAKSYTLRVMVIDSAGNMEQFTRTVLSKNLDGSSGLLEVSADYGFNDPRVPFKLVNNNAVYGTHNATFVITSGGSPGSVQYQFDADGDGAAENTIAGDGEDPENPDEWETPTSGNFTIEWTYQGIGFYPAAITVRTIDTQNNQIDVETLQMPLSIVKGAEIVPDGVILDTRADVAMSPSWSIQAGGGNGQTLAAREVLISGGRRGNTALRSNTSVRQTFTAPVAENEAEAVAETLATSRLQMNQERYNHWQWTQNETQLGGGTQYYTFGGEFYLGGNLNLSAQCEVTSSDPLLTVPWGLSYEMGPEGYLTLSEAAGDHIGAIAIPGTSYNYIYVFVGGVKDRTGTVVNQVSRRLISFDPSRPLMMPPQPAYVLAGPDIPTARYDTGVVYDAARQRYYVIGGRVASGESVRTVEAYDLNTGIWVNLPPMQDMRSGHTTCLIGGNIYAIGGGYYPPNESDFTLTGTAEVFNPDTGTWSYTAVPANVCNNAGAAGLPGPGAVSDDHQAPNTIWYFGGEDEFGVEQSGLYELVYFYTVFPDTPPE